MPGDLAHPKSTQVIWDSDQELVAKVQSVTVIISRNLFLHSAVPLFQADQQHYCSVLHPLVEPLAPFSLLLWDRRDHFPKTVFSNCILFCRRVQNKTYKHYFYRMYYWASLLHQGKKIADLVQQPLRTSLLAQNQEIYAWVNSALISGVRRDREKWKGLRAWVFCFATASTWSMSLWTLQQTGVN